MGSYDIMVALANGETLRVKGDDTDGIAKACALAAANKDLSEIFHNLLDNLGYRLSSFHCNDDMVRAALHSELVAVVRSDIHADMMTIPVPNREWTIDSE